MAGSMTDHVAEEIHDELHVRSLVLDDGARRIAFAICDSCAIPSEVIAPAKHLINSYTGIPMTHIVVAASHTHSAPAAAYLFQSKPDPRYQEFLSVRIADAVRMAVRRLRPARVGWGSGRAEGLVFNRRYFLKPGTMPPNPFGSTGDQVKMNPVPGSPDIVRAAGPVDPEVSLLAVEDTAGKPIAVLASYALHYVGGCPSSDVTADYFACWARAMNRLAGAEFVAILANACSGNINNVNFLSPRVAKQPYQQMESVAARLAAESSQVWKSIEFHDSARVDASSEDLALGVRLPGKEDLEWARQTLRDAPGDGIYRDVRHIYAREALVMGGAAGSPWPATVPAPVSALRIGDLGIATFPGEAFVEMGLEVKKKSPFRSSMLIELANDYRGYIPTVEAHAQGGYETWRAKSSYLEVEAAPKMVARALAQLNRLTG